jgi:hypothetical protein
VAVAGHPERREEPGISFLKVTRTQRFNLVRMQCAHESAGPRFRGAPGRRRSAPYKLLPYRGHGNKKLFKDLFATLEHAWAFWDQVESWRSENFRDRRGEYLVADADRAIPRQA